MSKCREEGFAYAGLVSPETCLCGSAGEKLEKKKKLSDDQCLEGCSGSGLQACGNESAAAVYDGKNIIYRFFSKMVLCYAGVT